MKIKKTILKRSRLLGGGLLLLSSCSLISAGFSAWTIISGPQSKETDFTIKADNAYNLLKLKSTSSSSTNISICKYGFVDESDKISSMCLFSWTAAFYQLNGRNLGYINNNSITFYIKIKDKTTNSFISLFKNNCFSVVSYTTYNGVDSTQSSFSSNGQYINSKITLNNIDNKDTNDLIFNVLLTFNEEKASIIETTLSSFDFSKGLSFITEIGIDGIL